jgi:hypothetical protein
VRRIFAGDVQRKGAEWDWRRAGFRPNDRAMLRVAVAWHSNPAAGPQDHARGLALLYRYEGVPQPSSRLERDWKQSRFGQAKPKNVAMRHK